jgi:hypothetical protein
VEAVRSALIAGIAICGLAVVVLSILPWVTFENRIQGGFLPEVNASFSGLDISRSRDIESIAQAEAPHAEGWCSCEVAIGDGYFTTALGLLLIASAGIARLGGRDALGGGAAALAGLAVVGIAGFDAVADWNAIIWTTSPVVTDGTIQPALFALIVVGAIAAIDGSAVWAMSRSTSFNDEEAYDYPEDEDPMEGTEAWA